MRCHHKTAGLSSEPFVCHLISTSNQFYAWLEAVKMYIVREPLPSVSRSTRRDGIIASALSAPLSGQLSATENKGTRVRNGYPWVGFSTFIPTRWVYPLWGGYLGQEPTHPAGYPPGLPRTQSRASYIYIHFSILFQRIHCISLPNSIITIKITMYSIIYFQY
jgi:hypothetical protein